MRARRLTTMAVLTAVALTIFVLEAQLPPPIPVPGMKLGLANVVTVFAMYALGPVDTLMILFCRIFLGGLFAGGATLLYSLAGGALCYLAMLVMARLTTADQMWAGSAVSAIFFNLGQMGAAILIARTPQLAFYLPILLFTGVCAGLLTGFAARFLYRRLRKLR